MKRIILLCASVFALTACHKEPAELPTYTFHGVGEWPGTKVIFNEYDGTLHKVNTHKDYYAADKDVHFDAKETARMLTVGFIYTVPGENDGFDTLKRYIDTLYSLNPGEDTKVFCFPETPLTEVEPR